MAEFKIWNPNRWNGTATRFTEIGAATPVPIVIDLGGRAEELRADEVVLARALRLAGLQEWAASDDGPTSLRRDVRRLTNFTIHYEMDGDVQTLTCPRTPDAPRFLPQAGQDREGGPKRADRLWVDAHVREPNGGTTRLELPVDVAVLDPEERGPDEYQVLVKPERSGLNVYTLVGILENACFQPWEGPDDDSEETQRERFTNHARDTAARLLMPAREARRARIERLVRENLSGAIEEGERVVITGTARHGKPEISISLRGAGRNTSSC